MNEFLVVAFVLHFPQGVQFVIVRFSILCRLFGSNVCVLVFFYLSDFVLFCTFVFNKIIYLFEIKWLIFSSSVENFSV